MRTEITKQILDRKGATKFALIPENITYLLNKGLIESVNLTEWLAVDHYLLIENTLPAEYQEASIAALNSLKQASAMQSIVIVGKALYEKITKRKDNKLFSYLSTHVSDSVRCWATYVVGANSNLSIKQKLEAIKPFAADTHFGVREIAWMATRAYVEEYLEESIQILTAWTSDSDANVRRFASEAIRPRGVWCKHLEVLKEKPQMAISILEPLKSDPSKYVQDSVANWLNDASKTQPEWVTDICQKWEKDSQTKQTEYIIKRALRSINK